jgi:hypothetical protein
MVAGIRMNPTASRTIRHRRSIQRLLPANFQRGRLEPRSETSRPSCEAVHIRGSRLALSTAVRIHPWKPPMPMSIEELERSYRRAYRRLSIGIAIVYGAIVLAAVVAVVGNKGIAGWTSGAVQAELASRDAASVSEPMQPASRIRTVKND